MSKGLEAVNVLKEEKIYLSNYNTNKILSDIEKELKKPQELYNKIKEKRDNAVEEYINYDPRTTIRAEIKGQIAAYNDVLSLMESMK